MAGSSLGNIIKVTTWGESHGKALGAVVDGIPAGLPLCEDDIQLYLNRRKPGQSSYTTPRKEDDVCEILSGVFEGKTTGTPISVMVKNTNQKSKDYSEIAGYYRPGHADFTFDSKYGFRDYRGGGRSSGRETIGRVIAGAICAKVLNTLGIKLYTYTKSIGDIQINKNNPDEMWQNPVFMPDNDAAKAACEYLDKLKEKGDSTGGIVEGIIEGVPAGLGDPVFEKLDANLAKAIFSIGAVKGFEIGDGFEAARATGSTNNDSFINKDGKAAKATNHSGGILGGISDGSTIVYRAAIKPTPSISMTQKTVDKDGKEIEVSIKGRHDPIIVPRAVVVVEAMAAITVLDAYLMNRSSKLSDLEQ